MFPTSVSCALSVRGDGVWSSEEEEVDECEPKPVLSFIEAHTAFVIDKSCFHTHSIGECDKQNILNLVLALFYLKLIVST
jgi:hypothetical protein